MGQTNSGSGDNVGRDKNVNNIFDANGKSYYMVRAKELFTLYLDRITQENEFVENFLERIDLINKPMCFFVCGCMEDNHSDLINRFEQRIRSKLENKDDSIIKRIEANIFNEAKSYEEIKVNLYKAIVKHVSMNSLHKIEKYSCPNELLIQPFFMNSILFLNHTIFASRWNKKMRIILEDYVKFWNCESNIKVVIFFRILDDKNRSLFSSLFPDINPKIESIIKIIKELQFDQIKIMTKLSLIDYTDLKDFEDQIQTIIKGFSLKLGIKDKFPMKEAVEKYSDHVAQSLYEHHNAILINM